MYRFILFVSVVLGAWAPTLAAELNSAHTRLIEGRLANQFQATRLRTEAEEE